MKGRVGRPTTQPIECYRKSLQDNPLLWTSFEALCRLGAQPDPEHYFRSDVNLQQLAANITVTSAAPTPAAAAAAAVETITPLPSAQAQLFGPSGTETPMSALQTPAQTPAAMFTPITPGTGAFVQPFALAGSPAAVPLVSALGSPAPWSYTTPSPARTPGRRSPEPNAGHDLNRRPPEEPEGRHEPEPRDRREPNPRDRREVDLRDRREPDPRGRREPDPRVRREPERRDRREPDPRDRREPPRHNDRPVPRDAVGPRQFPPQDCARVIRDDDRFAGGGRNASPGIRGGGLER